VESLLPPNAAARGKRSAPPPLLWSDAGAVSAAVRQWGIRYRANNGVPRPAVVLVPAQYNPRNRPPALRLVISPHGRGIRAITNAGWWRDLPAQGNFAVVCPGGMGRRLPLYSWGWRGQIADLARMPSIVRATMPWLRIDLRHVYAVGGSMGGQETLLLLGQHPQLLAGAVAFDSVTNFYTRYGDFARIRGGRRLQTLARLEVGGTPSSKTREYVLRSPSHWVREVARSGVPLQLWWSNADEIVGQEHQSEHFYEELRRLRPRGRVEPVTGSWHHTAETYSHLELPAAVKWLGLVAQ
jgi:dipeptidyl aminopeptidase/acylaminoacyl peptidase